MVPVRKPGRPLSTCPCPPGRPCACGGVRVAIPKNQKCACPTEDADEGGEDEEERSPAEPPTSPSRPSYRVGKPNGASKTNGRRQSFDPSKLERMDPRSVNLIAAPASTGIGNGMVMAESPGLQGPQTDLAGFGLGLGLMTASPYASPPEPTFGSPMPYGIGFQYTEPNPLRQGIKMENGGLYSGSNGSFGAVMPPPPFTNGNHAPPHINTSAQPTIHIPKANGATSGGSCCGTKAQKPPPPPTNPPASQQGYGQAYIPQPSPSKGGSCCSGKAQKPAPVSTNAPPPHQVFGQPYLPQFPYPTIFRYPGDYGSWQHPIDPVIWQQVASQTSALPLSTAPLSPTTGDSTGGDMGTSHQCSCGEGCQCVGCLAHPFNAQMFQYVNNAYGGSNGSSPGGADGGVVQTVGTGQESPAEGATPAASAGSPSHEEQSLSTLDYFFVNLPISGLCGGSLESCPCGDSCDCPGCLVHHIPMN